MIEIVFKKIDPTEGTISVSRSAEAEKLREKGAHWIVCRACSAPIARRDWILSHESDAPLFFSNPHGRTFHLLLVTHTEGMSHDQVFTIEHTWFAGYEWSIGVCRTCRSHLGWQFRATRPGTARAEFAALSRSSVQLASDGM